MDSKIDASAADALLALVPADGGAIGNTALRKSLEKKLGRAVAQCDYLELRDALVEQGKLIKAAV